MCKHIRTGGRANINDKLQSEFIMSSRIWSWLEPKTQGAESLDVQLPSICFLCWHSCRKQSCQTLLDLHNVLNVSKIWIGGALGGCVVRCLWVSERSKLECARRHLIFSSFSKGRSTFPDWLNPAHLFSKPPTDDSSWEERTVTICAGCNRCFHWTFHIVRIIDLTRITYLSVLVSNLRLLQLWIDGKSSLV